MPLISAFEIGSDIVCPDCLSMYRAAHPEAYGEDTVPLFYAELKPNDKCEVCCRWLVKEPIDA